MGTETGPCGVPKEIWETNGTGLFRLPGFREGEEDYFYQYGPLYGDGACNDRTVFENGKCGSPEGKVGYFGKKVLAVSFGGTLDLKGWKGACYGKEDCGELGLNVDDPLRSAPSWTRLREDLAPDPDPPELMTEHILRAEEGDEIVVTTTDYLPTHS
jgi:hypothetical protein